RESRPLGSRARRHVFRQCPVHHLRRGNRKRSAGRHRNHDRQMTRRRVTCMLALGLVLAFGPLSASALTEEETKRAEALVPLAARRSSSSRVPALPARAKDPSEVIRKAVARESRHVGDKAVIDLLIGLLADDSSSVADGALRTLYGFTGRLVDRQDFVQSTKE